MKTETLAAFVAIAATTVSATVSYPTGIAHEKLILTSS